MVERISMARRAGRLLFVLFALVFLLPFVWMVLASFMPDLDVSSIPPTLFPKRFYPNNYIELFRKGSLVRWFFNSVFVSSAITACVVLLCSMAGYSFARKRFPGRDILFMLVLMTMMLPRQILLVPLFRIANALNLFDTYAGLILPALAWPFGIFLMRQFMITIPGEIMEAAEVDGCSQIGMFVRIMLPMAKPGIGALAIFTFLTSWNDYMWQVLMISSNAMKSLPLGIASFQEEWVRREGLLMAGATLGTIPMVAVFLAFQKHFTKSITLGAVKG